MFFHLESGCCWKDNDNICLHVFCNQCVGQRLSPFFFHSPKLCRLTLTRKCAHTHTPMLTDTCLHARTLTPLRGTILARPCHPPTHFSSLSLESVHFTHSQHNTYTSLLQHPFALRHTSAFKHKHWYSERSHTHTNRHTRSLFLSLPANTSPPSFVPIFFYLC